VTWGDVAMMQSMDALFPGLRLELERLSAEVISERKRADAATARAEAAEARVAELEAKLAAIPMDDIQRMQGCEAHTESTEWAKIRVKEWQDSLILESKAQP